jgi:sec-independent protein translocase protein TatA
MIPGGTELMIIFGVALLIFGPSKLPQLGKAVGESIKNFKKGIKDQESTNKEKDQS